MSADTYVVMDRGHKHRDGVTEVSFRLHKNGGEDAAAHCMKESNEIVCEASSVVDNGENGNEVIPSKLSASGGKEFNNAEEESAPTREDGTGTRDSRVCMYFARGCCRYKAQCKFSHVLRDSEPRGALEQMRHSLKQANSFDASVGFNGSASSPIVYSPGTSKSVKSLGIGLSR